MTKTTSGIHQQEEVGRAQIIPPKVKQSVLSLALVKSWEDVFKFPNWLNTVSKFNNLKNLIL